MEYPKFSVIIPQKNRAEYLVYTLKTCMIQDYPNFEVIVSDDCSEDNSVEIVEELAAQDPRIKLFAHKTHLGMRDNFEFALNQVKEGYVMALGGDDGLMPGCIWRMYEILKETGKELLTWAMAGFVYPDPESVDGSNIIFTKRRKDVSVKILKSEDFLNKIATTFEYQIDECPMFYMKGVASMNLVNRVKSRTPDGCFYYCPTPDGFSGVVLAGEVEDYAYTNEPLSIVGNTKKSQGRNYYSTEAKAKKEAEEFFNDNIRRTMHKELASQQYSPLIPLMTADYLLTARDLPGWPGKFKMFTFESLLDASFKHMAITPFQKENLVRELKILREIAIQHDLLDYYNKLLRTTKRKLSTKGDTKGLAITHSMRLDGSQYGIHNIYDASLAMKFIFEFSRKLGWGMVKEIISNSFQIFIGAKFRRTESFPSIDN